MTTIADKLQALVDIKNDQLAWLQAHGSDATNATPFAEYVDKFAALISPGATYSAHELIGTYDNISYPEAYLKYDDLKESYFSGHSIFGSFIGIEKDGYGIYNHGLYYAGCRVSDYYDWEFATALPVDVGIQSYSYDSYDPYDPYTTVTYYKLLLGIRENDTALYAMLVKLTTTGGYTECQLLDTRRLDDREYAKCAGGAVHISEYEICSEGYAITKDGTLIHVQLYLDPYSPESLDNIYTQEVVGAPANVLTVIYKDDMILAISKNE